MIRTLIEQGYNVLFSGPTGTAKTASIQGMLLGGFSPDRYSTISFAFSAQTTANQCQDIIDGKLDKKKGRASSAHRPIRKCWCSSMTLICPSRRSTVHSPPLRSCG